MERTLEVIRAAGALGAELRGIDLRRAINDKDISPLTAALTEHLVVFVRDQDIDLEDLENLTDLLGGRDVTPYVEPVEGHPHVIRVIKEPTDVMNFANAWHTDLSYLPEPPAFTLLHARDVPDFGGDTVYANQYMAFKTLSRGLRRTVLGLSAVHTAGTHYGTGGTLDKAADMTSMAIRPAPEAWREQVHPVVRRHPITGDPALYVNPVYTTQFAGWTPDESRGLLDHLFRHSSTENITFRLRWEPGTIAVWDNRCVMHNALNDYSGVRREAFRTSVKGTAPEPAQS
ncbi:MAG TPA: TauD/TfdA family dioxygenase [Acidimicrobiales bacterium]|jgi:taurine dioxygenase|nr:TauD/TfdA family dioxygenase [Acidimicrobiales bacterium]